MRAHGVFALGDGPRDAVKAAVMCEDAARTCTSRARSARSSRSTPTSVDALYDRYQNVYGQH